MNKDVKILRKRHIVKTITWRVIGTLDTMFLVWIITGAPIAGLKIGGLELMTKFILYYLHERFWSNIRFKDSKKQMLKLDKNRKHSPLKKMRDAILIRTDKLNKKKVLLKMSQEIERINYKTL